MSNSDDRDDDAGGKDQQKTRVLQRTQASGGTAKMSGDDKESGGTKRAGEGGGRGSKTTALGEDGGSDSPKTTFIGGGRSGGQQGEEDKAPSSGMMVVGWVVIVDGPGRGSFRPIYYGLNSIGRDREQRICLNFGDESISRSEHAYIVYDDEQRTFHVQHGGKANIVRLNAQPVMTPMQLAAKDQIRIGKTTLQFVPFCGVDFDWTAAAEKK